MTDFEKLLERAKAGDKEAQEAVFRMYRPLLIKNAMGAIFQVLQCAFLIFHVFQ